jgi:hypothetical protein
MTPGFGLVSACISAIESVLRGICNIFNTYQPEFIENNRVRNTGIDRFPSETLGLPRAPVLFSLGHSY